MKEKKVVFMGTPDFAVPILQMLIEKTNVVLVVTQPDKCVGRKQELVFSPIKRIALANNISVFQPQKIRNDYEAIKRVKPDLIITAAYGQILPKEVLDIPVCGCVNVHASLLPKYRGSAPIQWAILNKEKQTGVTLIYMNEQMDAGKIIAAASIDILESDDLGSLHDKLREIGTSLLEQNLEAIFKGQVKATIQDEKMVSFAPLIKRSDEHLDLYDSGENLICKIRAFHPWPLVYVKIDDEEMKILKAYYVFKKDVEVGVIVDILKDAIGVGVKNGILYFTKIKPFGKKAMSVESYLNGVEKKSLLGKRVD